MQGGRGRATGAAEVAVGTAAGVVRAAGVGGGRVWMGLVEGTGRAEEGGGVGVDGWWQDHFCSDDLQTGAADGDRNRLRRGLIAWLDRDLQRATSAFGR